MTRQTFLVKLAFVITVNKSEEQILQSVGIYLSDPVFNHGQLYLECSGAGHSCDIKVKINQGQQQGILIPHSDKYFTKNVVYREIFNN